MLLSTKLKPLKLNAPPKVTLPVAVKSPSILILEADIVKEPEVGSGSPLAFKTLA